MNIISQRITFNIDHQKGTLAFSPPNHSLCNFQYLLSYNRHIEFNKRLFR